MGREIRRVPPNWEHPRDESGEYISMHDETLSDAVARWKDGYEKWENGGAQSGCQFWDYDGPPPMEDGPYRPEFTEEPTWFQVYQTVSEGTPVTPPFATEDELIDYLATNGDFWCQSRPNESPPSRESAEAFVKSGWAPSFMVSSAGIVSGVDASAEMNK